mmetsp:Transcript_31723/g.48637  ORF Transcript_31723/g.48637 Transcript_31723/m.48637 type:complete len:209 (+) Transcript_31723:150-776(+)|eukprot:CAMPEP_0195303314 /NCGR_PEP_ID=MMETSP0707-20130614/32588_1 /TAXON_ID=33640 /ORGANISM="Asterionellopsis glacialis, Strain CCMP134" /LENGTH=208 /DNA_ID=CAMNT_0040366821 /DNA_START=132 /DNA_END=758 /DNA_ORIENTATION=-
MGAGKNKAHRKNRISKHVLDSQKKREEEAAGEQKDNTPQASSSAPTTTTPKKKKSKKNRHVKDPKEAATYLSSWKHREAGTNWKFNKNTQSWLIRHMYEADKVDKTCFGLLLEYLSSGDDQMQARVRTEGTRRALRYKDYQKNNPEAGENKETAEKEPTTTTKSGEDTAKENGKNGDEDDTTNWNELSDHDKRKEYKRARKVLDVLKE